MVSIIMIQSIASFKRRALPPTFFKIAGALNSQPAYNYICEKYRKVG